MRVDTSYCRFHITFVDYIPKIVRYFRTSGEACQIRYVTANKLANFITNLQTETNLKFLLSAVQLSTSLASVASDIVA